MKSLVVALASIIAGTSATVSVQAQTPASPARVFTPAPVAVLTQRYDNARTAANLDEHILNVSSVESGQFQSSTRSSSRARCTPSHCWYHTLALRTAPTKTYSSSQR